MGGALLTELMELFFFALASLCAMITGWLLAFSNYDKALAVQPESCINMLKLMYLVIPFVLDAIITFILSRMKVEEANDKIRAEMKN